MAMQVPSWLEEILAKPTCDVPEAGRALGLSRPRSYAGAARGYIKTIDTGDRRKRVSTAWLRRTLQLDEPASAVSPRSSDASWGAGP
jgi:hypothetical protein